jgi:predicted nucleic acid-binding protein
VYCFDTDVVSATMRRDAPLPLVRRLAVVPVADQFTTSITLGELVYGAARKGSEELVERIRDLVLTGLAVLAFDQRAAELYGRLRAQLERDGRRLAEPDLRIASIALARDLTLVTGNVKHFQRVPELRVENWLATD